MIEADMNFRIFKTFLRIRTVIFELLRTPWATRTIAHFRQRNFSQARPGRRPAGLSHTSHDRFRTGPRLRAHQFLDIVTQYWPVRKHDEEAVAEPDYRR